MHRRLVALSVLCLFSCSGAFAWGPATHAYVAIESTGLRQPAIAYGATVPDMDHIAPSSTPIRGALRALTHGECDLLGQSAFALGFATHNGIWGADAQAHGYVDPDTSQFVEGYMRSRSEILSAETGLSRGQAETFLEAAVDFLICTELAPETGAMIFWGGVFAGGTGRSQVVAAFAGPLAEAVPDLTQSEAEDAIAQYSDVFMWFSIVYGSQLGSPRPYLMFVYPMALSLYVQTDFPTSAAVFARALEMCSDYEDMMDVTVEFVREGLVAHGY
jgi:hypothetical protein